MLLFSFFAGNSPAKNFLTHITFDSNTISSVVPPALLLAGINAYNLWNEHWEHWAHMPPLEERPQYAYMNLRMKAYPWGDGDKVSVTSQDIGLLFKLTFYAM